MKAKDLKDKTALELRTRINELRREILNLRFQKANGQLESTAGLRFARRNIARVKTVMTALQQVRG